MIQHFKIDKYAFSSEVAKLLNGNEVRIDDTPFNIEVDADNELIKVYPLGTDSNELLLTTQSARTFIRTITIDVVKDFAPDASFQKNLNDTAFATLMLVKSHVAGV